MEFLHTVFINVVPFLVVLTVLVFVHELGHYLVARWCGVHVEVFSIGFGPELWGWTAKNGTRWKFSLIPLGGYVKMTNEDEVFAGKDNKNDKTQKLDPTSLLAKTPLQKIAISAAGPIANYLFAFVLMGALFAAVGQRLPIAGALVNGFVAESVAEKAGVLKGDIITHLDGQLIKAVEDVPAYIASKVDQEVTLTLKREGAEASLDIKLRPQVVETHAKKIARLGIELAPVTTTVTHGVVSAVGAAIKDVFRITVGTMHALGQMIMGQRSADGLSGPLGIANIAGKVAQHGILELVMLAAFLSINLGLVNLFPLPVLDGGHIMLYLIEWVRGRPVTEKIQEIAFRIGFGIILLLILFSFWNDLNRLKIIAWVEKIFQ